MTALDPWIGVVVLLVAMSVALAHPVSGRPGGWGLPRRGSEGGPGADRWGEDAGSSGAGAPRVSRPLTMVAVSGVSAGALIWLPGTVTALGGICAGTGCAVIRLVAAGRRRSAATERERRVVEACEVLASELRAGQPPGRALLRCAQSWSELRPVATAAGLGADVPSALRRVSVLPGARDLADLAAAWQVSAASGAGLAAMVDQVGAAARATGATRRVVLAELASAQATARLVAVLPLLVLMLGSGVGGDPWHFLLRTPVGLACLATGLALALTGLTWMDRIGTAVFRS